MSVISKPIKNILVNTLGLNGKDKCLVITDHENIKIGIEFYNAAKEIANSKLVVIPTAKVSGEEPPEEIAKIMKEFSVIVIATTKSISHTKSRREATAAGARIASMPGINEGTIKRTFNADYNKIKKIGEKLIDMLGKELIVKTEKGTDIILKFKNKFQNDTGIYSKKSEWGNLPGGEVFACPVSSEGVFVVDASIAGIGKLKNPVKVYVKNNLAVKIEGKNEAKKLKDILDLVKDKNAYNIAEFGLGTNYMAKVSGNVLEDEKVLGTCHIAFGNNVSMGGKVNVPLHLDCVISKPTIFSGNKKIMDKGKLV